ncbi:MAG TPA: hypothetical protein VH763_07030 [Gemmatimonadales bacterium]
MTRSPAGLNLLLPESRRRYDGLVVSLLVHVLVIGLAVYHGERLWSRTLAPGDPALPRGGGGGGGHQVAYISLPLFVPPVPPPAVRIEPIVPPKQVEPHPVPEVVPPSAAVQPPPKPVDTLTVAAQPRATPGDPGAGPGASGGTGGGAGLGVGPGIGPGAGDQPGTGGGAGGTSSPPELRDLAFPFDTPPKELRGASLNVTFWVKVDGRVERYEIDPRIMDQDYARKFDEVIRAFRFTPARAADGSRIAGTTTVTFTLPGKSKS